MTYTEEYLLNRFYDKLTMNKKSVVITFPDPVVRKEGKKTIFTNFKAFCEACNRPINHLVDFISKSMHVSLSISGNDELIINGIYKAIYIKKYLINYLSTYVICSSCKSGNTEIIKEHRLNFLSCKNCMCKKSIIKDNESS